MKPVRTQILGLVAGGLFATGVFVADAAGQTLQSTDRAFAALNFGSQTKARTFTTRGSFPLYDETATFESTVGIGNSGIFDISAGVRVWRNLAVGLGYSRYSDTSAPVLTASIPDPLFFDTAHERSAAVGDLEHRQGQIHLSAHWLVPVTDKFDAAVYAGPTLFSVKQDLPTGITVTPGTSTIASVTRATVDKSGVGLHFGVDFRYLVTKYLGAGAFLRFTSGSVTSDLVDGDKLKVGGFQFGAGLRARF